MLQRRKPAMNDLTSCVEAFEEAFAEGRKTSIEAFAPQTSHPDYAAIVLELARVELELRGVQDGIDAVADYCRRFPAVFGERGRLSQIAFEEFRVRRQRGDDVDRREYSVRYQIDTAGWPVVAPLPGIRSHSDSACTNLRTGLPEAAIIRGRRLLLPSLSEISSEQLKDWLKEAFPEFEPGEELGRGAFGRVFVASQRNLANRLVVIKVTSDTTSEPERLAQLQHTNIVPVYSVHRTPEWQAICMPYFGRRTLRNFIDSHGCDKEFRSRGTHSPPERPADSAQRVRQTLRLVEQVATGLHHAHSSGILHRDIKPANILVTDQDQALLLDFNLSSDLAAHSLTRSIVGGTLPYLAPEHLNSLQSGDPISVQADIYSLGVILFELLSGRLPYPLKPGSSLSSVVTEAVAARNERVPSVRDCRPDVSRSIDAIIAKCLQFNPANRYQTAMEVAEDIHSELENLPLRHTPDPSLAERWSKWRRRNPRLLSVTSLTVICSLMFITGVLGISTLKNRIDVLNSEARWQHLVTSLPEIRTLLSAPDAAERDLNHGIRAAKNLLADFQIEHGKQSLSMTSGFQTDLNNLGPTEQSELTASIRNLAFLIASGQLRLARFSQPSPEQKRLLGEASEWNGLAAEGGLTLPEFQLQRLSINAAMGHEIAEELHAFRSDFGQDTDSPPSFALAIQTLEDGCPGDAEQQFARLVQMHPHDFSAWFLLGKSRQVQGNWTGGDAAFSTCVALNSGCWLAWRDRGICRLLRHLAREAAEDFHHVLSLRSDDPAAYLNLALAQIDQGLPDEAEATLSECLRLQGPTRAWFIRAQLRAARHDAQGAADDFRTGQSTEPNEVDSWIARGMSVMSANPEAALQDFETAKRWNPKSRDAMQNIAHVYSERLGRTDKALQQLEQLLALYPNDNPARIGLAVLLARDRQSAKAVEEAQRVLRQNPQPVEIYQSACVFALINEIDADQSAAARGLELLRQSLQKQPDLVALAADDADLNSFRRFPEFQKLLTSARTLSDPGQVLVEVTGDSESLDVVGTDSTRSVVSEDM